MLKSVHLVGEDEEDDLYGGFEEYNPALDTGDLYEDHGFQQALKSSYGNRPVPGTAIGKPPGTSQRLGTAAGRGRGSVPGSSMGARPMTGLATDPSQARPMTAVRAAGYSSAGNRGAGFDPLNQARGPAPPLETKAEDSPEEKIRQLEKKVNELIEESAIANEKGEFQLALEKAKEAGRKERTLCRQREQTALSDQINLDITYSVLFNLANQYHANQMYQEAINSYQVIVKNKMFSNAGRLRVNMGNIYFEQRKYSQAIKQYRMALDQISNKHKDMRIKVVKNIAVVFIKLGQYSDALSSYEHIVGEKTDIETAFNLLMCYYALGDKEKMKRSFQKLVQINLGVDDEEKYTASTDDTHQALLVEVIRNDQLRHWEKERKATAEKCIIASAKLISPVIEASFDEGFDWCVDCVKNSSYVELANELEITKAIAYLKMKDFPKAIETLKTFEKKDSKMASQAAVNLSFLYFLEGDVTQASKHADIAVNADLYNPFALVNKGNCLYANGDLEKARDHYQEALHAEASCTEALFNLGIVYKKLEKLDEALDCFHKFQAIIPNHPECLYQLANCYELADNLPESIEWYHQLLSLVPTDPAVLSRLGEIYDAENDKSQAFQYHYESFRYYPSNIETISWLGAYYIDAQFVEKAMHYFEKAALVQPSEVKWQMMVASCHRRTGNYQQALDSYKSIHNKFPDNIECLKFLVRLCNDQGLTKEVQEYAQKLKKAEKAKELRDQRAQSGTRRGSARSGSGRLGSGRVGSSKGTDAPLSNSRGNSGDTDDGFSSVSKRRRDKLNNRSEQNSPDDLSSFAPQKTVDASYVDPLGDAPARPKTAAGGRAPLPADDEFGDEELGDDLLPE